MEPTNEQDCHAVCVRKDGCLVGHLEKGTSGKFAQAIFFFLRTDKTSSCDIIVIGRLVNLGVKKGQKVPPYKIQLAGQYQFVQVLERQLDHISSLVKYIIIYSSINTGL